MNTQLLIDRVVQQTMVFIAQLATAGGVRAPLVHVANRVFLDLSEELSSQGVTKKVIADMFGLALRTYHRRVQELRSSRTDANRTLWEAVLDYLSQREAVAAAELELRFRRDDAEVLSGVLNDLVGSGLVYRAGRGESAVYRVAGEADLMKAPSGSRGQALRYLVWLTVYRHGPLSTEGVIELSRLGETCRSVLGELVADGHVRQENGLLSSARFDVPLGTAHGWEAAVLDHFQAMVTAISTKLGAQSYRAESTDTVGGSTWSLDVWSGHPHELETLQTLQRVRTEIEDLRRRVDQHNALHPCSGGFERVVFYMGQYVREEGAENVAAPESESSE